MRTPTLNLGIPDRFIEHGSREDCLAAAGLDPASIEAAITRWWRVPAPSRAGGSACKRRAASAGISVIPAP